MYVYIYIHTHLFQFITKSEITENFNNYNYYSLGYHVPQIPIVAIKALTLLGWALKAFASLLLGGEVLPPEQPLGENSEGEEKSLGFWVWGLGFKVRSN